MGESAGRMTGTEIVTSRRLCSRVSVIPSALFVKSPSQLPIFLTALLCSVAALHGGAGGRAEADDALQLPTSTKPAGKEAALTTKAPLRKLVPLGGVERCKPGPWGELEYFTAYLEAPMATIRAVEVAGMEPVWTFPNSTDAEIETLLKSAKLPEAIATELLDRARWKRQGSTTLILPTRETLAGLPEAARATIYAALARWPENEHHHEPFTISGGDVRTWLSGTELREEILTTIEKTAYRRGRHLVFSDVQLVHSLAQSDAERYQISKALSRTATLMVKMLLKPDADVSKLVEYWSTQNKRKDIAPFLESMALTPGVDQVDIIHLLPPTARKLLNSYPNITQIRGGMLPDCHWTSLNFLNDDTVERLVDTALASAYTTENFERIATPYRFGDVLFFVDAQNGSALHSCVYIADDIVFTKNGRSLVSPWVLMKLTDVFGIYELSNKIAVQGWRRKWPVGE